MYFVYLLKSDKDNGFYIGLSSDLKRRVKEHNTGLNKSTKHRAPFKLVYFEAYPSKSLALQRERRLKQFKNAYKELLKRLGYE